jgi:hypothetical protein
VPKLTTVPPVLTKATERHGTIGGGSDAVSVLRAAGIVTNFGTVHSSGGRGVHHGLVETSSSSDSGIALHNTAGTVINSGTVESASGDGVYLQAGGVVTNQRGASIEGANGVALGGPGSVTNLAKINGIGAKYSGVYLVGGDTLTNGQKGSSGDAITGTYFGISIGRAGSAGAKIMNFGKIGGEIGIGVLSQNTADNTVVNAGTITGSGGTAVQFGAGNDVLIMDPGAAFFGAVNGGGGVNKLVQGAPGVLVVDKVSAFEKMVLANGGADQLTLTDSNFTGIADDKIYVFCGNDADTVDAAALASPFRVVIDAGNGADVLTGGAGDDVFYAGGDTTMKGGGGANDFIFKAPGAHNAILDFAVSKTNKIVVSNAGFDLGQAGATLTPQKLPAALFGSNKTGGFNTAAQRFAYDTSNGDLYYDAHGNGAGGSKQLVVHLAGDPAVSATQLFFVA